MSRSRFVSWLIDEGLPALAFSAGYAWVPEHSPERHAPTLQSQLGELFDVVAREEKGWAARHRVREQR